MPKQTCSVLCRNRIHGLWKSKKPLWLPTLVSSFCPTCNASISLVAVSTAAILYISKEGSNLNEQNKQNCKHQYNSGQLTFLFFSILKEKGSSALQLRKEASRVSSVYKEHYSCLQAAHNRFTFQNISHM